MPINIELKARAGHFEYQKSIAGSISDTPCEILVQEDVFFYVPKGRLKLRIFSQRDAELIWYQRENMPGPKKSDYRIVQTTDPGTLKLVLASSLGVLGTVRKKRFLYHAGQTRIHFDEVDELGRFIELEFVMKENQPEEEGISILQKLLRQLEIKNEDFIEEAYIDLMLKNQIHKS